MFTPIIRAERAFQGRALRRPGRLSSPFVFGLLIGGSSAAALMLPHAEVWAVRAGATALDTMNTLRSIQSALTILVIVSIFADYWRVVGGAVRGASIALTREYQARTWESLILTGVSARRLVIGKWWGVLRAVWEHERKMLFIRLVAFPWLLTPLANPDWDEFHISGAQAIIAVTLVALLTPILMSGFAAALGMMVSAVVRQEAISVRTGMGALLLVTLTVLMLIAALAASSTYSSVVTLFSALLPLDGGILAALSISFEVSPWYSSSAASTPAENLLIIAAVFAAMTAAALYAAVLIVQQQGALADS